MDVCPCGPLAIINRETRYDHAPLEKGPPVIAYKLAGDENAIAGYCFRSQGIDKMQKRCLFKQVMRFGILQLYETFRLSIVPGF
jgi:hypothetical protein